MLIEPTPFYSASIPPPVLTVRELEELRKMLVQQIDEAAQLYDLDRNGSELQLSEAALASIEALLLDARKAHIS